MAKNGNFPRKMTVRIDEDGYGKLKRISGFLGVSMANVIRDLIRVHPDFGESELDELRELLREFDIRQQSEMSKDT